MENIIEIKDISFSYNDECLVLENFSLNIKKGKYSVIIGHNGSGKSTLAKLIIGLLEAESGSIFIEGLELNEKNLSLIREKVGIVFQNPDNQFIGSTVEDDIAFGLENHCVPHEDMKKIILDYAEKVNMTKFLEKEPSQLSGGQKQRVAIAGVLAMKPQILILDEATSMLDPKGKREIKELIKKMRDVIPGLTIISITHDIDEAISCDEVIVMNKGKVFKVGTPQEIFESEKELLDISLDLPFAYKLYHELNKQNIKISKHLDSEGMVNELCPLSSEK